MIYVISHPAGQRDTRLTIWLRGTALAVTALVAGATLGAILGEMGGTLSPSSRNAIAWVAALCFTLIALTELSGRHVPLPQLSRETNRTVPRSTYWWAIRNGIAMGTGIATRIGFWVWYALPILAILSGDHLRGAAIVGTYGGVRGMLPLILWLVGPAGWRLSALSQRALAARANTILLLSIAGGLAIAG